MENPGNARLLRSLQGAGHGEAMKEAPETYWKTIFGFLQES